MREFKADFAPGSDKALSSFPSIHAHPIYTNIYDMSFKVTTQGAPKWSEILKLFKEKLNVNV